MLEKLWDDVVAGPQPESGLGRLRKITTQTLNIKEVGEGSSKYQRSASMPSASSPGTPATPRTPTTPTTPGSARKDNVWRSVFHPGSNLATKGIGAAVFDKPSHPNSPTIYDWSAEDFDQRRRGDLNIPLRFERSNDKMARQPPGLSEIDKLNGQNYKVWRIRVEFLLEEEGLTDALMRQRVKPSMSIPPTEAEKAAMETYSIWAKQVRRARILILNSLSNDLMPLFVSISNAKDLWDQLEQDYNATSSLRRRNLFMHFHRYRKKDEASMMDHLLTMRAMIAELREVGHDMSDEVQVESVLTSLPHDWDHFVVQMRHNLSVTTFDSLKEHIEMEVDWREFMKTNSRPIAMTVSPGKAKAAKLKAKRFGRKTGNGKQKPVLAPHGGVKKKKHRGSKDKNKNCFTCGKEGHFARDCTEQGRRVI